MKFFVGLYVAGYIFATLVAAVPHGDGLEKEIEKEKEKIHMALEGWKKTMPKSAKAALGTGGWQKPANATKGALGTGGWFGSGNGTGGWARPTGNLGKGNGSRTTSSKHKTTSMPKTTLSRKSKTKSSSKTTTRSKSRTTSSRRSITTSSKRSTIASISKTASFSKATATSSSSKTISSKTTSSRRTRTTSSRTRTTSSKTRKPKSSSRSTSRTTSSRRPLGTGTGSLGNSTGAAPFGNSTFPSNGTAIFANNTLSSNFTSYTGNTTVARDTSSANTTSPYAPPPKQPSGRVRFGGMNMAGFDFGCTIDGTCTTGGNFDIVTNSNALQQMQHFVNDDKLNAFRLPVGWQYLVNNNLGGALDPTNLAAYDKLVQGCLNAGAALCMIDIHNYARYNGQIVGQGGPTNEQFASLWSQLATKYAKEPRVAFDVMNEPHDIPDLNKWANSTQAAVTAIRKAGALTQMILLPGTDFASAGSFVSSGSAAALSKVQNPGGGTAGLVYNVHKYLDSDGSGTHANCVTDNIDSALSPLATYLRQNKRVAMLTETGGGPTDASCMTMLCQQMDFINANADVYLGVITWAAGGFDRSYIITETPNVNGAVLTDQPLVTQCVVNKLGGASGLTPWM